MIRRLLARFRRPPMPERDIERWLRDIERWLREQGLSPYGPE